MFQFGSLDHEDFTISLTLSGQQVMPAPPPRAAS
jgi:hypothetical protein